MNEDEKRIMITLERATETIRKLRTQLDVALEALEFCAAGESLSREIAIETLERIDAIVAAETEQ